MQPWHGSSIYKGRLQTNLVDVEQVTLFEAAMPPMIAAAIIATEHDLDPPLANLMVAVGLMLSFLTLTGWWWVLRGV